MRLVTVHHQLRDPLLKEMLEPIPLLGNPLFILSHFQRAQTTGFTQSDNPWNVECARADPALMT
ncbi:MAG: hypothetical protein Q6L58_04530, partial [Thermostichales cyanobacterium BF3_bins_165]